LRKDNIKDVWKGIKQLIILKKANHTFPTLFEVENEIIFNPTDIVSKFNDYFTSIGPKLVQIFLVLILLLIVFLKGLFK
jgi:hypothetical protein